MGFISPCSLGQTPKKKHRPNSGILCIDYITKSGGMKMNYRHFLKLFFFLMKKGLRPTTKTGYRCPIEIPRNLFGRELMSKENKSIQDKMSDQLLNVSLLRTLTGGLSAACFSASCFRTRSTSASILPVSINSNILKSACSDHIG